MPLKCHRLQIAVYAAILDSPSPLGRESGANTIDCDVWCIHAVCVCRLLGSKHNQLKYGTNIMLNKPRELCYTLGREIMPLHNYNVINVM